MDSSGLYLRRSSSSSAIDLTGTPVGIAPPSPSLEPTSRRRISWGKVDAGQDPLQLDTQAEAINTGHYIVTDDHFESPTDVPSFPRFNTTSHYEEPQPDDDYTLSYYSNAHAGPSTASLLDMDGTREDDQARLTANMSRNLTEERWREEADMERAAGLSPRAKRRTIRYSVSPSPLKKTGTAIMSVSKSLRRASLRVVNLGNNGLENQVRLPDNDGEKRGEEVSDDEPLPDLSKRLPIRGRTLGFLGPQNKLRLWLYDWLVYP